MPQKAQWRLGRHGARGAIDAVATHYAFGRRRADTFAAMKLSIRTRSMGAAELLQDLAFDAEPQPVQGPPFLEASHATASEALTRAGRRLRYRISESVRHTQRATSEAVRTVGEVA